MSKIMSRRRAWLAATALTTAIVATPAALAGTVTGKVIDASGTSALQAAQVTIVELRRVTNTASDGTFRFVDVPAGTYTVRVRYAGAGEETQQITVSESGDVSVQVTLAAAGNGDVREEILVVGQRANLLSSLARQRASDTVDSVLTRDAMGQFPDQNVAESLRRAPGLNILNDQGEGRFVSVRGLDPNLNAASINGSRVPAPESDVRSVALDVIPSELIESIEVKKSLTPDMDGDTIGASIEINTTSAFDREKPFVTVKAEGSYNDLRDTATPKGSVDFSTRIGERFGIAGGVSYYKRKFSTDNVEMDDWEETDDGDAYAETLEYRDYDVDRERIGATLSLDFKASDSTTLFARGLYSRFEDQEFRRRLTIQVNEEPSAVSGSTATFLSDDGEIEVERDLKDRFEVQKIASFTAGGKTVSGPWEIKYEGSYSEASEKENGSVDPVVFKSSWEDPGQLGVMFDYSNLQRPAYSILNGGDLFTDALSYEFDELERTTLSDAKDKEYGFKIDMKRTFVLDSGEFDLQAGVKPRFRKKRYDANIDVFDGYDGDLTLADVVGKQSYSLADIEPVVGTDAWRSFLDASGYGAFELNQFDTDAASAEADYSAKENILAGYLMGRFDNEAIRVIGGVRVERTKTTLNGNVLEMIEEGAEVDGVPLEEDTVFVTPVSFKNEYTDWLPSLNIRANAAEDVVLRFGAYKSVVRPNFGQMAPRFLVEENDENEREGEFGNPNLKPYKAWNFDASAEYYFDKNAGVTAGIFYKSIKDFIVDAEFEEVTFNGVYADEALIRINGDKAKVKGFEFSYQQAFTMLPAPFDGLLTNINYTYTDAEGDVLDRTIALPSASKHTFNMVLGYEKDRLSLRVAGTYRDGYLDELGGDPEEDRYVKDHFQVDVSAKYEIMDDVQLFAELVNLNNAKYTAYRKGPGADRLLQFEEYKWTAKFGVRATF
ncbi:TonB-dependent receptor [Gimibacter soli]|uniref:TonB-dependent receptor n=1 Tax=Gimibacter soli TaxID=3024400 RepID=A0AAE9XRX2_9PROT|nr:TonB-dependent receptor [Gimibacter soli]WCL53845.1 TonB-dependent receptor [Gimibacter soli]